VNDKKNKIIDSLYLYPIATQKDEIKHSINIKYVYSSIGLTHSKP